MPAEERLTDVARAWILRESQKLPKQAVPEIKISPSGRHPKFLSWILDRRDSITQVVLWYSGEFEADFAEVASGEVRPRSGRVASLGELESLLAAARDRKVYPWRGRRLQKMTTRGRHESIEIRCIDIEFRDGFDQESRGGFPKARALALSPI